MDNRPIGIFDSGLGGLTAIPRLQELLPDERLIYFGDTARTPYGSKSVATIRGFAAEIVEFLLRRDAKLILIACNTVSSTCIGDLNERFPEVPIVGIISPMARLLAETAKEDARIGVIGTKVTIESGVYPAKIEQIRPELTVLQQACPVFVPMIEEGFAAHEMMRLAIKHYLDGFVMENQLDQLVLGCTHYPLIRAQIESLYPNLEIMDPSEALALEVRSVLTARGLLAPKGTREQSQNIYYASDLSANFVRMIREIMGDEEAAIRFRNLDQH